MSPEELAEHALQSVYLASKRWNVSQKDIVTKYRLASTHPITRAKADVAIDLKGKGFFLKEIAEVIKIKRGSIGPAIKKHLSLL